jgi:predicted RNase H-like HicB family nuclease
MEYNGYLIEPDKTGYAPKDSKYFIFKIDEEKSCGFGSTIEDCKKEIDELILERIKVILEEQFGWGNLDCEDNKWFVDELIKDVHSICTNDVL